jgi:hypothetical protein
MKRVIVFLLCAVALTVTASAEVVSSAERSFRVKYRDGTVELYKVRWVATSELSTTEHGGPAKPLEGKFVDDRRCQWSIDGGITRSVSLVTRNGKEFINADKTKVFNSDFRNEGTSFDLLTFRPGNCGDTAARRNSDFADAKRATTAALAPTVARDFETVKREYQTDGAVVEQM